MPTDQETRLAERAMLSLLPEDHPENMVLEYMRGMLERFGRTHHLGVWWVMELCDYTDVGDAIDMLHGIRKRGLIERHPQKGWFLT